MILKWICKVSIALIIISGVINAYMLRYDQDENGNLIYPSKFVKGLHIVGMISFLSVPCAFALYGIFSLLIGVWAW